MLSFSSLYPHLPFAEPCPLSVPHRPRDSGPCRPSSQAGIHKPVGHSVEVWDADDIDGPALGVPTHDIASGEYFWNQTAGPAAVLTAGTVVLGNEVYSSTDGAVGPSASDNSAECRVGTVLAVGANTEYSLINLQIRA